ncbi:hypothetical protein [Listeria ivanovii]|uniref:hypothetical protein n=1 Tax=Listeria ivanovii TaxID=1638 RepID=UPI000AFF97C4|nr:hypothetical protein [Listeria ivanovii]MBK1965604.1 hypothetical protein [Listeria ivanovii subsp. londoniensis]MBK1983429.1 hypothetical protein [Listeria ivanovii subsp. londoniensis]MBK1994771.1 hypothetical protein [Listeria ivanovii subsp. londoniensis]
MNKKIKHTTSSTRKHLLETTSISTQATIESTLSENISEEKPLTSLFDALSQELKVVLMADTVDSHVKHYSNLEGFTLYYTIDNKDIYLQITSGTGTGHPIYKLLMSAEGATPIQGICYLGNSAYDEVEVNNELVPIKNLLQTNNENKSSFDNATNNVQHLDNLKELFEEQMSYVSNDNPEEKSTSVNQLSDEDILNYFINNILDDVGVTDSLIKQQANSFSNKALKNKFHFFLLKLYTNIT